MHTKSHFKYAALSALISCVVFCCVFISMCVTFPLTAHAQFEPPPGTPVPGCPAGSTNPNCAGTPGNTTPAGGGPGGANPGTGNPSGGYVPLEPLPFLGTTVDFANYLRAVFQILMIGGSILAVVMIVVGGVQYMTSDVLGTKEAGRERIKNAVFGLLLLLSIYIILKTINPDLLTFKILTNEITPVNTPSTPQVIFPQVVGVPPATYPALESCRYLASIWQQLSCEVDSSIGSRNARLACSSAGGNSTEVCGGSTCTRTCSSSQGFVPGQ